MVFLCHLLQVYKTQQMCKGAILASAAVTIAEGLLNLPHNLLKWNIVREKTINGAAIWWVLGGFCIGGVMQEVREGELGAARPSWGAAGKEKGVGGRSQG